MAKKDTLKTAPIVPGGCYRKKDQYGRWMYATIQSAEERHDGRLQGMLTVYNNKPRLVIENTADLEGWELYAQPMDMDHPVKSERIETEQEQKDRELAELRAENERLRRLDVTERVIKLADEGTSWANIGHELNIPWQTAKSLYEKNTGAE